MNLQDHQQEICRAYVRGGPGAIVSGTIWLIAAITAAYGGLARGFAVLFFGGMLIFPISRLLVAMLFRRPSESPGNPGGLIVMETVVPMIGGLFAAWLLLPVCPTCVFPVAAIAVGAHYFGFRTAYGDGTYWVFGGLLCLWGTLSVITGLPSAPAVPFWVAGTEFVFGIWFLLADRADSRAPSVDG